MKKFYLMFGFTTIFFQSVVYAEIKPTQLANTRYSGKNSDGHAELVIHSDLSWHLSLVSSEEQHHLSGTSLTTTVGFDNLGTLVVLLKHAGAADRENAVYSLGTTASKIEELKTLEYDDLVLEKRPAADESK